MKSVCYVILPPGSEAEICFFNMPENCTCDHKRNNLASNQIFLFALTVMCYMEHFTTYAKKDGHMFCVPNYIMHNIDTKAKGKERNGLVYKLESQFLQLLGFSRLHEQAKFRITNSFIYNF